MKKLLCIVNIILLILSLYGCSNAVEEIVIDKTISVSETTVTTTVNTTEPTMEQTTAITTTQQDITTTKKQTITATTTKKVITTQKPTSSNSTTIIQETTTENGCAIGNHSMPTGNMEKWFNSRSEVQAYVSSVMEGWNNKHKNGEITRDEYIKNCPQGYKSWSCSSCGKWTGNFTY